MIFQSVKTAQLTGDWFKKTSIILIVILAFSVVPSVGQADAECGKAQIPFTVFPMALEYFGRCSIPTSQLTSECLMSSCPKLSGLSPFNSDNSVDPKVLALFVATLNDCITKTTTICGITMASTPMEHIGWTFNSIFPAFTNINGSCILNPNSGNINNLNQAHFSVSSEQNSNGKVILTLSAPNITQFTSWNCYLSIPSCLINSSQTGSIELFHFPNVMATLNITVSPTFAIDFTVNPPTFNVINDALSDINVNMFNFKSCSMKLPQALVDAINQAIHNFFKASKATAGIANFYSTFATQAAAAAEAVQSCRLIN